MTRVIRPVLVDEVKVRPAQVAQPGTRRVVIQNSLGQPNVTRKVIVAKQAVQGVQKQGQKVIVKAQGNERIVVQKKPAELKSSTVKIENLAAGTTELQIRRMCQAVGTIEVTIFT